MNIPLNPIKPPLNHHFPMVFLYIYIYSLGYAPLICGHPTSRTDLVQLRALCSPLCFVTRSQGLQGVDDSLDAPHKMECE